MPVSYIPPLIAPVAAVPRKFSWGMGFGAFFSVFATFVPHLVNGDCANLGANGAATLPATAPTPVAPAPYAAPVMAPSFALALSASVNSNHPSSSVFQLAADPAPMPAPKEPPMAYFVAAEISIFPVSAAVNAPAPAMVTGRVTKPTETAAAL